METEEQLIRHCRYYTGSEHCPYSSDSLFFFWRAESHYVKSHGQLNEMEDDYYRAIGGKDYPGIPRAILINMFFLWGKGVWDIEQHITDFYRVVDEYLDIPSEYIPKGEIPQ